MRLTKLSPLHVLGYAAIWGPYFCFFLSSLVKLIKCTEQKLGRCYVARLGLGVAFETQILEI